MKSDEEILKKTGSMYSVKTDRAWAALQKEIAREEVPKRFVKKGILNPLLFKIAAAFIILLALGWGIRQWTHLRQHRVKTVWTQKTIQLTDGSVVFLNGNSKLTYPDKFSGKMRVVKLQGEAFFKIKKDNGRPFVVKTQDAQIQVFGTSFNVNAPEGQSRVEVLVKTGVVGLSTRKSPDNQLILHPGEFGLLKNNKTRKIPVPNINYLSWQTKIFRFRQENLVTVVGVLGHAYAKDIELSVDSLKQLQLTSTYENVDIDTILESICLTFHLKQEKSGNKIILSLIN